MLKYGGVYRGETQGVDCGALFATLILALHLFASGKGKSKGKGKGG
jgi:hypothetical protein